MPPADGTLLVPIANPETVDRLMDTALDIARERSMRILAIHVVEVPPQVPLSEGRAVLDANGAEEKLLEYASERIAVADVEGETRMRYARDVATGIVSAVGDSQADTLLLGWRGRPRRRDIVLGGFIDSILADAPCDVFVKRIRSSSPEIGSILVPVSGGPHEELTLDLAGIIAAQHDASVHLVNVLPPNASEEREQQGTSRLSDCATRLGERDLSVETLLVESDHIAGALTDESSNHDLTILGATEKPLLKRKIVGSVAEGVGRSAASSVILARRANV